MKKFVAGAAMLMAVAGSAAADTLDFLKDWKTRDIYLGFVVSDSDVAGETGLGQDMNAYNATIGYNLWGSLSVEARVGAGTDQVTSLFQDPLSNYAAGMLRYHYTWSNDIMAYASAGAAVRTHSDLLDADKSQIGAAFAVGVNLFGSDNTALNLEYLYMGGEQATSSFGIGFQHYFR